MTDLNANLYYMTRFEMCGTVPEEDLLWTLILGVRSWMCNKWRKRGEEIVWDTEQWTKWKKGCSFHSDNGSVTFISAFHQEADGRTNWACRIIEAGNSAKGYAPREWVTEIGFRQKDAAAQISFVIFYRDRPGFIGLCESVPDADAGVPNLIRRLLENERLKCTVGGHSVSLTPTAVSEETYPAFRAAALDPAREIPLLYISPMRTHTVPRNDSTPHEEITENGVLESDNAERSVPLLDPLVTSRMLGPDALVYYGTTSELARIMSADPDRDILECYNGGIRVYMPHPDRTAANEALRHRYLSRAFIQEHGAEKVYALLRRALAQDSSLYESVFRVEDCRALIKRAQLQYDMERHREQMTEELFQGAVEKEERLSAEFLKMDEERLAWEIEKEALATQLSEVKADFRREQRRADNFQEAASKCRDLEQALKSVRDVRDYPETPQQIAAFFIGHFPERLDFTEKGWASLKDCQTAPEILWNALYDMATALFELYTDDRRMDIEEAFGRESTFSLALSAGMMTRNDNRLMQGYEDTYQGRTISIESHLKSNANRESDKRFLRIYYCFDRETGKLVIGSCGRHKENYSTRKVH